MQIDYGGRRTGKTTKLIGWVLQDVHNRSILCHSTQEADRVRSMIAGVVGDAPKSVALVVGQTFHGLPRTHELAIDNLDMVLPSLLGRSISCVAMNDLSIPENDTSPRPGLIDIDVPPRPRRAIRDNPQA